MKIPSIITLALLVGATTAALAATDPLTGTWRPQPRGKSDTGADALQIVPIPGGCTFRNQHGGMTMDLTVIPDGKPHSSQTPFGPITATCRRLSASKLECNETSPGMPPMTARYALSADGRTLTETDTGQEETVEYSASESVSGGAGGISHSPPASRKKTSGSAYTETTVFHRQ